MTTSLNNSHIWKNTVQYGVSAYSFLMLGKKMSGKEFVEEIKKHYDYTNPRTRAVLQALENHLVEISVRTDGQTEYSTK